MEKIKPGSLVRLAFDIHQPTFYCVIETENDYAICRTIFYTQNIGLGNVPLIKIRKHILKLVTNIFQESLNEKISSRRNESR